MKRHGNLFNKITSLDNLYLAHHNARKGKTHYKEVKYVDRHKVELLLKLRETLISGNYITGKYTKFTKIDKNKQREIYKLSYYPDRIVHHAILQILEPIWKATLIHNTYQSIKKRGTMRCINDVKKGIKKHANNDIWVLKLDVKKYYPSVNNFVIKQIIRRKIKCKYTLKLLDAIIDSHQGLPIGNYISQYLGNIYLSYFDQWVKSQSNILEYYRYCDDLVILTTNKENCKKVYYQVKEYLHKKLHLSLNKSKQYFSLVSRSLDFVGCVFHYNKEITLRKKIKMNFINALCKCKIKGLSAYWGWITTIKAYALWKFYLEKFDFSPRFKYAYN